MTSGSPTARPRRSPEQNRRAAGRPVRARRRRRPAGVVGDLVRQRPGRRGDRPAGAVSSSPVWAASSCAGPTPAPTCERAGPRRPRGTPGPGPVGRVLGQTVRRASTRSRTGPSAMTRPTSAVRMCSTLSAPFRLRKSQSLPTAKQAVDERGAVADGQQPAVGAGAGQRAGQRQTGDTDQDVHDVVRRVDHEAEQVVAVPGVVAEEVVEPGDEEADDADQQVDGPEGQGQELRPGLPRGRCRCCPRMRPWCPPEVRAADVHGGSQPVTPRSTSGNACRPVGWHDRS